MLLDEKTIYQLADKAYLDLCEKRLNLVQDKLQKHEDLPDWVSKATIRCVMEYETNMKFQKVVQAYLDDLSLHITNLYKQCLESINQDSRRAYDKGCVIDF